MPNDSREGGDERTLRTRTFVFRTLFVIVHLLIGLILLSPVYIEPDSVGTYAWLRSAVVDHDLLFFNEWAAFDLVENGYTRYKEVTSLSTLANHWGYGTSLLVAPVYVGIRLLEGVIGVPAQTAGFFGIYGLGLALMSVFFVAVTLLLLDSILADRGATRWHRVVTVAAVWLGTPLFWYQYRFPLGTHAAGALCVAVLCWLIARRRDLLDWEVLAIGIAFGLAVATRIQHLALFPAVAYALAVTIRPWRSVGLLALGAGPPIVVQGLAWSVVYGSPTGPITGGANLVGSTWAPLQRITFDSVLLSSYHGLLSWSPVIVLSLVGWWIGRRWERRLVIVFVLMFLCELVANSTMDRYFWGGMAFGARRFVDLAVPFGFGIWIFLRGVSARYALPAVALTVGWSISLFGTALAGRLELLHDVSWSELLSAGVDLAWIAQLDLATLNSPLSVPASLPSALWAIALILVLWALGSAAARRPRLASVALMVVIAFAGAYVVSTYRPTRQAAVDEMEEFEIDRDLAMRAGPLLDQRALLIDELSYYRRAGRESSAEKTIEELRAIDRMLAEDDLLK